MKLIPVLLFFGLLITLPVRGEERPYAAVFEACKPDIESFCREASFGLRETGKCLEKNDDKISISCKQEIQRIFQVSRQTTPRGGPLGAIGGLTGALSQLPSFSYEGRFVPGSSASVWEHVLAGSMPIYKNDTDTISATLAASDLHFTESLQIDSGRELPKDYLKAEIGLAFTRKLANYKTFGMRGSFGFSGDKFQQNTQNYNLSANYSFPTSQSSAWVLLVLVSNNNSFGTLMPIPGFFYLFRTPTFTGLLGLPVASIQWTPLSPWSLSFSILGPQLKAEVAYGAVDAWQVYSGFSWKQQRYLLSDSATKLERLTLEEKSAELGLRRPLFGLVFSELQSGYAFDRAVYVGERLFRRTGGSSELAANWFLRWSVKVGF
jgi:hypothetical protein